MQYKSKGYVFDEEVTAWLDKLKEMHGSYNKGLRLIAFQSGRKATIEARVVERDPVPLSRELVVELDEGDS